jgi:hypothetical protein
MNKDNYMVLYADDTSIIITDTSSTNFTANLNQTFKDINIWFKVNHLTLNFNKTQYLKFQTMKGCNIVTQINYGQKIISNVTETRFLGLTIDVTLSWKQHIDLVININQLINQSILFPQILHKQPFTGWKPSQSK